MYFTLPAELLVEGLNDAFMVELDNSETDFLGRMAMMQTTTKRTEIMAFIGEVPAFREWVTRRQVGIPSTATYQLTTKDWENSISFDENDLRDEQLPMIAGQIGRLARQARRHSIQLAVETLVAADTLVAYDGVSLYNDAHPARGEQTATQDNLLASAGTTVANLQANYDAGYVAMQRFQDESGQPAHGDLAPNFLFIAPPELWRNFSTVLFSTTQPTNDGTNVYQGQGDLVTTARLVNTGDHYMTKTDSPVKPLVWLERTPIRTSESFSHTQTYRATKERVFGADASYGCGVGLWQTSIKFA